MEGGCPKHRAAEIKSVDDWGVPQGKRLSSGVEAVFNRDTTIPSDAPQAHHQHLC